MEGLRSAFRQLSLSDIARLALVGSTIAIIIVLIITASGVLTPFIVGLVLAYVLTPVVNRLNRWLPRWAAILLVYAVGIGVVSVLLVLIVPPLISQVIRLASAITQPEGLTQLADEGLRWYRENVPASLQAPIEQFLLQRVLPTLQDNLTSIAASIGSFILRRIVQLFSALSFIVSFLAVPVWLFYVLNDARRFRASLNRQLSYRARPDFWNVWRIVDRGLSAYLRGQLTLGVIVGVASGTGLAILDLIPGIEIDYILLLAIWAGIAELVPMIGALLGAIPATAVALFVGGPLSALAVLILFTVIQFVENNYLVPRVIGESTGVHPAILIVALVIFGNQFGLIGVFLTAPALAIARDLYQYTYRRLRGDSPGEALGHVALVPEARPHVVPLGQSNSKPSLRVRSQPGTSPISREGAEKQKAQHP